MLKKQFTLIFLATVFLSFDNQTKAMQESTTEVFPLQQDILCEQEISNILTLKSLAALRFLETLKAKGIDLSTLDPENKDRENILKIIPEELKAYCHYCQIIPSIIDTHINSIKQFKEDENLKITEENLNNYNKLLHILLHNTINIEGINIKLILQSFRSALKHYNQNTITLEDINLFLKLLMQPITIKYDSRVSEQEIICLNKIWNFIGRKPHHFILLTLSTKNIKVLPPLHYIIDTIHNGAKQTFFMFLAHWPDINSFKIILNKETNKNYNWEKLFSMRDSYNETVLHHAVHGFKKNMLEVILGLINEKSLRLDDFINAQNIYGQTPLIKAASIGNYAIVKLLTDHEADINISSKEGKTALDYAIEYRNQINRKIDKNHTLYSEIFKKVEQKLNRCIELLESATNTPINK